MSASVEVFQDNLRRVALKKRALVLVAAKRKRAKPKPPAPQAQPTNEGVLAEIREALKELRAVLEAMSAPGSVEFTVTERDFGGKIKSFRVDTQ